MSFDCKQTFLRSKALKRRLLFKFEGPIQYPGFVSLLSTSKLRTKQPHFIEKSQKYYSTKCPCYNAFHK